VADAVRPGSHPLVVVLAVAVFVRHLLLGGAAVAVRRISSPGVLGRRTEGMDVCINTRVRRHLRSSANLLWGPPSKEAAGPPFVSGRFAPTLHRPFLLPLASPNAFLVKEFSEVCLPHPWLRFGFRSRCGRVTQDA
jgi:hypothetical protein